MNSNERIESLIDSNTWRPLYETVSPCDPLTFKDQKSYPERLKKLNKEQVYKMLFKQGQV
jgi:acetyl-CoA carboxylase carboxyl transferase subunit beta